MALVSLTSDYTVVYICAEKGDNGECDLSQIYFGVYGHSKDQDRKDSWFKSRRKELKKLCGKKIRTVKTKTGFFIDSSRDVHKYM